ncbi:hypothetical protein CAPTEDRAFT_215790 [Capitella teleta]|uniref:Uncharacterized protein n=1 Tax=Capitella teleta TaxID=283909 RepID=R7TGV7_CAPTE|nr:hypothetical protein CAPTEDRAFT_215790 [Capitella teleta]|eukprot:ELT92939.1 hypothetical protein CAPTEDRAFT_215790 [Capitella teleta]
MPPIGRSDHIMVHLLPTYVRKLKAQKHITKTIQVWSKESVEELNVCFACNDWGIFKDSCSDLNELTDIITEYIKFDEDNTLPKKTLWRSGDHQEARKAQKELDKAIANRKEEYKQKIEQHFKNNNSRSTWEGFKMITGYKKKTSTHNEWSNDAEWAEQLNTFYCRFEKEDLDPTLNTTTNECLQAKKASKRLYHLRKLKKFKGNELNRYDEKKIRGIQKIAHSISGENITQWKATAKNRTIKLAKKIMQDQHHPLNRHYKLLPSGRRLSIPRIRTARFKRTFIPSSIISINSCGQAHPFGH